MKTTRITALLLALVSSALAERAVTVTWDKYPKAATILIYEKDPAGDRLIGSIPVDPAEPKLEEITLTLADPKLVIYAVAQDALGLKSDPSNPLEIPSKLTAPSGMKIVIDVKVTVTQ